MSFTRLQLANLALSELGEPPIIPGVALADDADDNKARVAFLTWPFVVDELLRESTWNFAKTRASLALASPSPLFEWDYSFALPDDYVTLLAINEQTLGQPGDWWEIESGVLFTNSINSGDTVDVEYIAKPTESNADNFVNGMDPLARAALATLWASRMASSIVRDGGAIMNLLRQRYLTSDLPRARMRNFSEQKRPWGSVRTDSAFDASRRMGPAG